MILKALSVIRQPNSFPLRWSRRRFLAASSWECGGLLALSFKGPWLFFPSQLGTHPKPSLLDQTSLGPVLGAPPKQSATVVSHLG